MTADLAGPGAPLDPPTVHIPAQRSASFAGTASRSGMPSFTAPTGLPPAPSPRRGGARVVGMGVAAAAVVLGLGVALASVAGTISSGGSFALTGELNLAGEGGHGSGSCAGYGGYSDIGAGTSVTVADATGTVVATGRLDSGRSSAGDCVFPFSVAEVPGDSDFYRVEVSHRGEVTFSRDQ
ncbi:hypothetical protein I4J48_25105, partial [Pseudonocardia sp. KRD-169]